MWIVSSRKRSSIKILQSLKNWKPKQLSFIHRLIYLNLTNSSSQMNRCREWRRKLHRNISFLWIDMKGRRISIWLLKLMRIWLLLIRNWRKGRTVWNLWLLGGMTLKLQKISSIRNSFKIWLKDSIFQSMFISTLQLVMKQESTCWGMPSVSFIPHKTSISASFHAKLCTQACRLLLTTVEGLASQWEKDVGIYANQGKSGYPACGR